MQIKPWKLFLLVFGFPALSFPLILVGLIMNSDPIYYASLIISLIAFVFLVLWLKECGNYLYQQLDIELTVYSNQKLFNFNLFFVLFYTLLIALYVILPQSTMFDKVYTFAVFPMHLYSMYSLFYAIYFVSKHLSIIEGKSGKFENFQSYFFMLLLYPVGIWTIQPKINDFVNE